ncbi:MAG: chorismate synthase [Dehalococcoidia bacterium]|nr:MAG: chorismate synthase [Dehalococcoidia bacterium]
MSSSLGTLFRITSFGESHGPCIGIVVDGCPAGLKLEVQDVQTDLERRRAVGRPGATPRSECDSVRFLSGVYKGRATGAPICMVIDNADTDPGMYAEFLKTPRPGHADYPAKVKYGGWNDPLGGGRFSGRITAGFVMAGAVARLVLRRVGVEVLSHTVAIGGVLAPPCEVEMVAERSRMNSVSCCDESSGKLMVEAIESARARGDSVGGVVECIARGLPPGIGEPVCAGVEGEVARAVFAIPAVKGIEFGAGFALSHSSGTVSNDPFALSDGRVVTTKNDSGGVLGGMTTGMPLVLRVAFKPTPSISAVQRTVDLEANSETELTIRGRHDACIVPRAGVVVEAMVAAVLCDLGLQSGFIPRVMR